MNIIPTHYTEDLAPISNNGGAEGSMIGQALQWNPTLPLIVKRANGTDSLVNVSGTSIINPLGLSEAFNDQAKGNHYFSKHFSLLQIHQLVGISIPV